MAGAEASPGSISCLSCQLCLQRHLPGQHSRRLHTYSFLPCFSKHDFPGAASAAAAQGWAVQEGGERSRRRVARPPLPARPWQGAQVLMRRAAAAGQTPAREALLRDPFPSPATTGNRSGNPSHKFFKLHLETSQAICSAGQAPGFLVHQKCRVCLFF